MNIQKPGTTVPLEWLVVDKGGNALTGGTTFTAKVRRDSDGYFWDFGGGGFKNSAWTTLAQVLSEVDSTNAPGLYKSSTGFATSSNVTPGTYTILYADTGTTAGNLPGWDDLTVTSIGNLHEGTAQAGAASTITLASTASATNSTFNGCEVHILTGTGGGQSRIILSYVGSTNVATVDEAWATNPDSTSVYAVMPGRVRAASMSSGAVTSTAIAAGAIQAGSFAANALGAVWDELISAHTTSSSYGAILGSNLSGSVASAVWNASVASYGGTGSYGQYLGSSTGNIAESLAQIGAPLLAAAPVVIAGGSSTVVNSNATQSDHYFDGMVLIAVNASGTSARRITSYANASGAFTLDSALPFTPSVSDQLIVSPWPGISGTQAAAAVWNAVAASYTTGGSMGAAENHLDANISSRSTMTQAQILSDATPFQGARIDAAISSRAAPGAAMALTSGERTTVQSLILTDATPFAGARVTTNLDTNVASRASAAQMSEIVATFVSATPTVAAGGSATVVRTNATPADHLYDGLVLVVSNTAGIIARRIVSYANTNGAFTVDTAFPFTPANGDAAIVMNMPGLTSSQVESAVWDAVASSHTTAGTFGLYAGNLTNLDTTISSRLATSGYTAPLTTAGTAAAVWNALTSSYTAVGSFGALLGTLSAPPSASTIATAVWSNVTRSLTDKVGYALANGSIVAATFASGALGAVWDEATSAHTTAGTYGLLITTDLDANIGSRLATSSYTAPLTSSATAAAVWNAATSSYTSAGSFGLALGSVPSSATIAGAVWDALLATHTGAGSFGLLAANLANLDATVSSRLATSGYTAPLTSAQTASAIWGALTASYTSAGTFGALLGAYAAAPTASAVATAVWAATGRALSTAAITASTFASGALGAVWDELAANHTTAATFGLYAGGLTNLDVAVSTRLATSGYTTPPTASAIATSVWGTTGGLTNTVLAASAISAIQAGMATAVGLTALQGHGDSAWATATGFATSSALATAQTGINTISAGVTAIQGTGFTGGTDDLHSAHALLAGAATGSALTTAVSTIDAHTDSAVAPLATAAALATDTAAIESAISSIPAAPSASAISTQVGTDLSGAHGAGAWTTATGFATPTNVSDAQAAINAHTDSATAPLATSSALASAMASLATALAAIPAEVWAADVSSYGTLAQVHLAGGALYAIKIIGLNQMTEVAGAPGTLTLYKDNGSVYATMTLRDPTAGAVTASAGEPAQRSAAS